LSGDEIAEVGIKKWPIWTKEVSRFDWFYESAEQCLFLEGEVTIETKTGNIRIGEGDFVSFPAGLHCTWNITKPVKKHYHFE